MDILRELLRWSHAVIGLVGLVAFWFPIFAKKGHRLHTRAGTVFAWSAYGACVTAAMSCTLFLTRAWTAGKELHDQPPVSLSLFLLYMSVTVFATVRQAIRVIETRKDPTSIGTPFHRGLAIMAMVSSVVVAVYAVAFWTWLSILLLAMSPLGLDTGRRMLRWAANPPDQPRAWFYEHMRFMLSAGITFHTSFLVFGYRRLFDLAMGASLGVMVAWFLPAAVGVPAHIIWDRYYRRKHGDSAPA